jgi:hypothetical protein
MDVKGFKLAGEAWVADDRLTIVVHGHALVLMRGAVS